MSVQKISLALLESTGTTPAWDATALTGISTSSDFVTLKTNLALNFFLDVVDSSRSIQNLADGFVDGFEDQSGVDDPNSVNELYDATNDLYSLSSKTLAYNVQMVGFTSATRIQRNFGSFTGMVDSKQMIISIWVELDATQTGVHDPIIQDANGYWHLVKFASNKLQVVGYNAGGSIIAQLDSVTTYTSADGPLHILASFNLATGEASMYINDVDDLASSPTLTNDTVDFKRSDTYIGATQFVGNMGDLYFTNEASLDFGTESNRRKFINADGTPVDLGSNGSTPTGAIPILFLHGTFSTWHTNDGDGGGMTIAVGAITDQGNLALPNESMTLVSEPKSALAVPDLAHVTLFKEDVDAVTLNSDLIAWASRSKQTITATNASNVLNATAHGLSNNDRVILTSTATDLPNGLSDTAYYIVNKTADTFQVSLTSGGAVVTFSDNGTGTHTSYAVTPVTLAVESTYDIYDILSASVDISGQPSDTDMTLIVQTKNTKDVKIHGQSLQWS